MSKKDTLVDKIINRLKNSYVFAGIIVLGLVVVALGNFTDSLRKVYSFGQKCIFSMISGEIDDSRESQIDFRQIRSKCQKQAEVYLKALPIQDGIKSKPDQINVSLERNAAATMRQWGKMIEADTACRRTRDYFTLLPRYFLGKNSFKELKFVWDSGEPYNAPSPLKELKADWLMYLQNAELSLASVAARSKSFELYNRKLYEVLDNLWSPNNILISKSGSVTAPVLYFLTRMRSLERRHSLLKSNEENPFEICAKDPVDNVFPIGINDESTFLFVLCEKPNDEENVLSLPPVPVLTGLPLDGSFGYYRMKNPGRRVENYSKERIDNRINILGQQVVAAKYVLRRHLGYWDRMYNIYSFVYNYFEPTGLTSLLAVASNSLRQIRVLADTGTGDTFMHLPSLEIIRVSFNNKESIWYNVNNIRVTQKTSKYHNNKCLDPILDFQVINYAQTPCIISSILFRHYGAWDEPKAQPLFGVLESAQTIDVKVSFEDSAHTYTIEPPIYIMPNSPGRFKLRLVEFAKRCPGSDTFIQLGLIYNNEICDTPIFHMDIRGKGVEKTHGEASEETDSGFTHKAYYKVEIKDLRDVH